MRIPRVLIAGLRGGSGKTLLSVGLQHAWRSRGMSVAPFKKGPDYIDASWSTAASGRPCRNLDLYLMAPEVVRTSFASAASGVDLAVVEGNRGLFDGVDEHGTTSTAELAKLLGAPVILVVDCTKATRTVAATVLGCMAMDPELLMGGVVLNRIGGARHESVVRAAVIAATGLPVLGALPRLPHEILPERHLGLVPPAEHAWREEAIREAAEAVERHVDVDAVAQVARDAKPLDVSLRRDRGTARGADGGRATVGVFRDAAFQFYYQENLEALTAAGADLVEISPLRDAELPDVDALYIGGGFPETLAPSLAGNRTFRASVRRAVDAGMPVHAECGGAVFLGDALLYGGREYPMASALPVVFGFKEKPQGHGYCVLETVGENPFFGLGEVIRGHEFHYTHMRASSAGDLKFAFHVLRGHGFDGERDGLCRRGVLATYTHIHALSVPGWAPALVGAAAAFRTRSPGPVGAGQ